MIGRIVEIQQSNLYLSVDRGFLSVKEKENEKGRVPLSDITALVLSGLGTTISTNLLHALQEQGAMVVLTGSNYHPTHLFWPLDSHHQHQARIHTQIQATVPLKKRLWKVIVQAKINNQAEVLKDFTGKDEGLMALAKTVTSGDATNREAQAARRYWPALMGETFRRNPDSNDINSFLNYGYAIIRASTARAVAATGMHPALGIYHSNKNNPFCLVDDLVEVFRPLIDYTVQKLSCLGYKELTPEVKKYLVQVLQYELATDVGNSPVSICIQRMAQTFYKSLEDGVVKIQFPVSIIPSVQLSFQQAVSSE
jgi:CRISPR-associated protein Cas1